MGKCGTLRGRGRGGPNAKASGVFGTWREAALAQDGEEEDEDEEEEKMIVQSLYYCVMPNRMHLMATNCPQMRILAVCAQYVLVQYAVPTLPWLASGHHTVGPSAVR